LAFSTPETDDQASLSDGIRTTPGQFFLELKFANMDATPNDGKKAISIKVFGGGRRD
jgi:hypothetical protein